MKTEKERQLADGSEEGAGEEPNQTAGRKPGPLQIILYSLWLLCFKHIFGLENRRKGS